MGDRANVCVKGDGGEVWFYTHSGGTDLPELLRAGLITAQKAKRLDDEPYLTRILFCHLLSPEDLYGAMWFGISPKDPGGDRTITIDIDNQTVGSSDYGIALQSFTDFINSTEDYGDDDDEDDEDADHED